MLRITPNVASECSERYAVITYDLAIVKPASQIHASELPWFDTVVIMCCPFHIILAFISSIVFFIDGSGGDTIMLEREVLASDLLTGFLSGKHDNSCKRLHPLIAAAFQTFKLCAFNISLKKVAPFLSQSSRN